MRQLIIQIDKELTDDVLKIAEKHKAVNTFSLETEVNKNESVVFLNVSNEKVENILDSLQDISEKAKVSFFPHEVVTLEPPNEEVSEQIKNITEKSTFEVFLSGIQSIGSWKGFLGYSACSAIVAWIGLYTETIYLLTASMLISPFSSPAMNSALATARGDWDLLKHSLIRYFSALSLSITVAALLTLIFRQDVATTLMADTSQISSLAVMLPLIAGFAGAINLIQSEKSSLVSGNATSVLIAASLAPPAAITGMAAVIGDWEMVKGSLYLLLLQLVGINFSGALTFRFSGLTSSGVRFKRGKKKVFYISLITTVFLLGSLLTVQLWESPYLQRSTKSKKVLSDIKEIINKNPDIKPVEVQVRFTRADIKGQNTLLCIIYLQKNNGSNTPTDGIKALLKEEIRTVLISKDYNVTPMIDITVFD